MIWILIELRKEKIKKNKELGNRVIKKRRQNETVCFKKERNQDVPRKSRKGETASTGEETNSGKKQQR